MRRLSIFLVLIAAVATVQAQDTVNHPNRPVTPCYNTESSVHPLYDQPITSRDLIQGCRHLTLDIDATGFFYDAEYATPFAKGYTVTGFRLSPALAYGINERAQLRVGFNATAFAGLDSLYSLRPTFSLIYAPTHWLTLIAGTIYGSNTHQLSPPVYDPSRWIYNYQEDGLQILTNTKNWNSDTWLDWNHYLVPWTADQERFTMGTRHNVTIFRSHKQHKSTSWAKPLSGPCIPIHNYTDQFWEIAIPTHFIANHRGGELKTIDTNTVTTFNERIGLSASYIKTTKYNMQSWSIDIPFYFYHLEDNTLDNGGKGFNPTVSYEFQRNVPEERRGWDVCAVMGYWRGDHYFSANGNPALWSANAYTLQHIPASAGLQNASDIRNILILGAAYEHHFKGLSLALQVNALYDLDLRKTDLLVGFYMRFKEKILLF